MPKTIEERFWPKVKKGRKNECWLWTASLNRGYGQLADRHGKPPLKAHRVSWELVFGPIPEGLWVLHKCDNPRCVNPNHLFLGDQGTNMKDAASKNRLPGNRTKGSQHHRSKVTEEQVKEVRRLYETGEHTQAQLAASIGITQTQISNIVRRRVWKHV